MGYHPLCFVKMDKIYSLPGFKTGFKIGLEIQLKNKKSSSFELLFIEL
jgi:hypothetical protein